MIPLAVGGDGPRCLGFLKSFRPPAPAPIGRDARGLLPALRSGPAHKRLGAVQSRPTPVRRHSPSRSVDRGTDGRRAHYAGGRSFRSPGASIPVGPLGPKVLS